MDRDIDYEKNNIGYDEQFPDGCIKCKNYYICGAVLPEWWWECKSHYICTNCDEMFGKWMNGKGELKKYDNVECPICLENGIGIELAFCDHKLCINCFKRCFYGDELVNEEPQFPYPENPDLIDLYSDFLNGKNNDSYPNWDVEYPLMKKYDEEYDKWLDKKQSKYENEENLHKCPLCRK